MPGSISMARATVVPCANADVRALPDENGRSQAALVAGNWRDSPPLWRELPAPGAQRSHSRRAQNGGRTWPRRRARTSSATLAVKHTATATTEASGPNAPPDRIGGPAKWLANGLG